MQDGRITEQALSSSRYTAAPTGRSSAALPNWIGGLPAGHRRGLAPPGPSQVDGGLDLGDNSALAPRARAGSPTPRLRRFTPSAVGMGGLGEALIHLVHRLGGDWPGAPLIPDSLVPSGEDGSMHRWMEVFRFAGTRLTRAVVPPSLVVGGLPARHRRLPSTKPSPWRLTSPRVASGGRKTARPPRGLRHVPFTGVGFRASGWCSTASLRRRSCRAWRPPSACSGSSSARPCPAFAELRDAGVVSTKPDRGRVLVVAEISSNFSIWPAAGQPGAATPRSHRPRAPHLRCHVASRTRRRPSVLNQCSLRRCRCRSGLD